MLLASVFPLLYALFFFEMTTQRWMLLAIVLGILLMLKRSSRKRKELTANHR
jgi:general stress protein CsbA